MRRKLKQFLTIPDLPTGYTELEYLRTPYNYSATWIDTGFKPNGNTRFRIDAQEGWNNTCVFFCAEDSWRRRAYGLTTCRTYKGGEVLYNNTVYTIFDYIPYERFVAEFSGDTVTVNGITAATIPHQNYSCNYNLYLFANSRGGATSDNHNVIIYSAKFWDNSTGEVIRDFVPVLDANGTPCMFDKVSRQCFYNQGKDKFLYKVKSTS